MLDETTVGTTVDDPRKLSTLLARIQDLAQRHSVGSVVVGVAAPPGDLLFPELVEFLRSALRVEDGIFRMTRERAVVHLADVDMNAGQVVFNRILEDFLEEFPPSKEPELEVSYLEVEPTCEELSTKQVLTEIFPPRLLH